MSKITTENCKNYLVQYYIDRGAVTQEKDWKRTKKYKNDDGLWVRDFNHPGLGNVSLLEDNKNNLSFINSIENTKELISRPNNNVIKKFDLTTFSAEQIKQAWKVYKNYYDGDPDDEFLIKNEKSIRFIPGILSWYMSDAYENEKLIGRKMTWDMNLKGFNIFMFDHKNYHEYGGDEYLMKKSLPKYFSKQDEYHYEILSDITVEELVRDLSYFGYTHVNSNYGEVCFLKKLFKEVEFNKIPFAVSQLEIDVLAGNLNAYNIVELNEQKINNENIAIFALNNQKYDVFNYLIKNNFEIPISEIELVISIDYMSLYDNKEKRDCFVNFILNYDKELSNDIINKLAYVLQEINDNDVVLKLFYKYGNQENSLGFAQLGNLIENKDVLNQLIPRLAQHDEELKDWLDYTLIDNQKISLIKSSEVRAVLTKEYMSDFLNDIHKKYLESLQDEAKRSRNGFMVIEVYSNGHQESWLDQRSRSVAEFVEIKNKILSYYDSIDNDNKPKYRTKF